MHHLFSYASPNQQAVEHAADVNSCHHVSSLTSFEFLKFDLICLCCHMQQFSVILSLTYQIYNYTLLPTCFMQPNTLPLDVYILQLILLTCSSQISHSK